MTDPPPPSAAPPPVTPVRSRGEVERRVAELAPTLRALGVERVELFGSFARGEQTDSSDVDLLADFARGTTLIDLIAAEDALSEVLGRKTDLVSRGGLSPYIGPHILRDARPVTLPHDPAAVEAASRSLHPWHRRPSSSSATSATAASTSSA